MKRETRLGLLKANQAQRLHKVPGKQAPIRLPELRRAPDGRKDLPPVVFPEHAKKYLGQEVMSDLQLLTAELDEYDLHILQGTLSLEEVMDYLAGSGLMDDVMQYLQIYLEHLGTQQDYLRKELGKYIRDEGKVVAKIADGIQSAQEGLGIVHHRALLGALMSDAAVQSSEDSTVQGLEEMRTDPVLFKRSVLDPLFAERAFISEIRKVFGENPVAQAIPHLHFFAHRLQIAEPVKINTADLQLEADTITQHLKGKKVEPCTIALPVPQQISCIKQVTFTKSRVVSPLIFGSVRFSFTDPVNQRLVGASVNVSRITGDLCLPNGSMASLNKVFAAYDSADTFQYLRHTILRGLEAALRTGTLVEAIDAPVASPVTPADNIEAAEPEVAPAAPTKTEAQAEIVAPETIIPKAENVALHNLTWEKTERALGRFQVELRRKGKHYKAVRQVDDGSKSIPFPNQHVDQHTLGVILKTALKALGIAPIEFMAKYY